MGFVQFTSSKQYTLNIWQWNTFRFNVRVCMSVISKIAPIVTERRSKNYSDLANYDPTEEIIGIEHRD